MPKIPGCMHFTVGYASQHVFCLSGPTTAENVSHRPVKSTGGTTGVLIGEITGQCMSQIVCILCATVREAAVRTTRRT